MAAAEPQRAVMISQGGAGGNGGALLTGFSLLFVRSLSCPVCGLFLKDPVALACGHDFCRPCLLSAVTAPSVPSPSPSPPCCPRCLLSSSDLGPSFLRPNLLLASLIPAIEAFCSSSSSSPLFSPSSSPVLL